METAVGIVLLLVLVVPVIVVAVGVRLGRAEGRRRGPRAAAAARHPSAHAPRSLSLHDELVARLRYFDGHSDTIGLFADAGFLAPGGERRSPEPFRDARVQKVAGIEARGFVLATAVALELEAGFVAVRKPGSVHPGPKVELRGPPDWRGHETVLRVQRHVIDPDDRAPRRRLGRDGKQGDDSTSPRRGVRRPVRRPVAARRSARQRDARAALAGSDGGARGRAEA